MAKNSDFIPFFTSGGMRYWSDVFIQDGWKIQQNHWSQICRILDPWLIRRGRGTYEECLAQFENIKKTWELSEPKGHIVLVVPGLARSAFSVQGLTQYLKDDGFNAVSVSYLSTVKDLQENTAALNALIDGLPKGYDKISFVTHSAGGLVVRGLFEKEQPWQKRIKPQRFVMIAPPNNGSAFGRGLAKMPVISNYFGPMLDDVSSEDAANLPVPGCEFGVIAGATSNKHGMNPFLNEDNDFIVKKGETMLKGAHDSITFSVPHRWLPCSGDVREAVARFLHTGRFIKGNRIRKTDSTVRIS